jgi:hypothetical protein
MDIPDAGMMTRPAYSILEHDILIEIWEDLFREIHMAKSTYYGILKEVYNNGIT